MDQDRNKQQGQQQGHQQQHGQGGQKSPQSEQDKSWQQDKDRKQA